MQSADLLVKNAYIVTVDPQRRVYTDGYLAFADKKISAVGSMADCEVEAVETIDGRGKAVLPGMANTHNHLNQVCLRGYNDDRWPMIGPLVESVRLLSLQLDALTSRMTEERSYLLARLHLLELTRAGYTATHDEHFTNTDKHSVDGSWAAVRDAGLRGFLARCPVDGPNVAPPGKERAEEGLIEVERLRTKFNSDLVEVVPGILNYRWIDDPEDMRRLKRGAEQLGSHFDIDMTDNSFGAELKHRGFEGGQVEYYRSFDLLNEPCYAGKAVGVRANEWQIIADHDLRISLVPRLRYLDASGIPLHHLLAVGVTPGIGTDAPAVTDCQNPWQAMRETMLAQNMLVQREKAAGHEPPALEHWATVETALEMSTIAGARTLFMDDVSGSLEVGKSADCVIVDLAHASLQPTYSGRRILSNLVWAGESGMVDTVFVAGRKLLEGGHSTIWDEQEVVRAAEQVVTDIQREAGASLALPSRLAGERFRGWSYS